MVDAPEFSQAHLYRLVIMVAGAGMPSYVRQLRAVELLLVQAYFRSFFPTTAPMFSGISSSVTRLEQLVTKAL